MSVTTNEMNMTDAQVHERIRDTLAAYSSQTPASDMGVAVHTGEPLHKISIPDGMNPAKATKILQEYTRDQQEEKAFSHVFNYRPWDGAVALKRVLQKFFGTSGRNLPIKTMFGTNPPMEVPIEISYGVTETFPWGQIAFAPLEGVIHTGSTKDKRYGQLFQLTIVCPKRFSRTVDGLFHLIEDYLKENSIYKGQAIYGTAEPTFMDLQTDPSIVYNQDVYDTLQTSVWGVIKYPDLARSLKYKVDPKVLLEGPFGTGKSETGRLTAKIAVENGWTFIHFNSSSGTVGDLEQTLQTARLLSPAVVFVEDIDKFAGSEDQDAKRRMLEMFDGISSKGNEVMVMMTSNDLSAFEPGMLRSGRIDKLLHIGLLDREASERLIRLVNQHTLGTVDFDVIYEAVKDFEPSFMRSVFDEAKQAAAIRTAEELTESGTYSVQAASKFLLNTEDFVTAAALKRPQWDLHQGAKGRVPAPTLDSLFKGAVREIFTKGISMSNENIGRMIIEEADVHAATSD